MDDQCEDLSERFDKKISYESDKSDKKLENDELDYFD